MEYNFIGERLEDAIGECERMEIDYRITLINGTPQKVKEGLNPDRYNFEVEENVIKHHYFG